MKILTLAGQIELLSGLHIGGGDDTMKIGGIDNQVIKDINTNKPYIPGSSLKGKMRSLLEWNFGLVGISNGEPFSPKFLKDAIFNDAKKKADAINVIKIFGASGEDATNFGITRISVGDASLIEEGLKTSEAKYENVIDRKSGTAQHPRQTERVPAGVKFTYNIKLKVLDGDDELALKSIVEKGLELVENDYLGGNGSRGYGRVIFTNKIDWK
jgi:CRISPR-associated protein Csm3